MTISAADSTVKGLIVSGFGGDGIDVSGNDVLIQDNYIGTDSTGTVADGNGYGISITSSNNTVGGTAAGDGNLISGNSVNNAGVLIQGSGATENVVEGNLIGTDRTGTTTLGQQADNIRIARVLRTIRSGAPPREPAT